MVSRRYLDLMNGPYDRIRNAAWGEATLTITYDGEHWAAAIERQPPPARNRLVVGTGLTLDQAVADLEKLLGLDPGTA